MMRVSMSWVEPCPNHCGMRPFWLVSLYLDEALHLHDFVLGHGPSHFGVDRLDAEHVLDVSHEGCVLVFHSFVVAAAVFCYGSLEATLFQLLFGAHKYGSQGCSAV
jgi:hypothetical protein